MARTMDRLETMPVSPYARLLRWVLRIWAAVVVLYLYLPIAFLILFSFEDGNAVGFPITGLTLHWYEGLPANTQLLQAIWTSVTTAAIVAVAATIVGAMAAFPLVRSGMRYPNAARIMFTLPIMLPGILIGVGILIFLAGTLHILLSQFTVVAGHLVLTMPFVVLIVSARLQGFDRRLEWAAADLGATPWQILRRIILPLIFPAILAGALISVTLSIDEFVVTFWTIGPQLTLPIYIYTQIKFGVTPEVNAVATLVLAVTLAFLVLGTVVATAAGRLRDRGRRQAGGVVGLTGEALAGPSADLPAPPSGPPAGPPSGPRTGDASQTRGDG